jgi:hypothetical protein
MDSAAVYSSALGLVFTITLQVVIATTASLLLQFAASRRTLIIATAGV